MAQAARGNLLGSSQAVLAPRETTSRVREATDKIDDAVRFEGPALAGDPDSFVASNRWLGILRLQQAVHQRQSIKEVRPIL